MRGSPGVPLRQAAVGGAILGALFGSWNLIATWLDPLADDSIPALLAFYGPMFGTWLLAGFVAARRRGRLIDAMATAGTVALATFVVFSLTNLVRVNLFLESVQHRADWQNMQMQFQASGYATLREFVNANYVAGAPFKIAVAATLGGIIGLIGGLCAILSRALKPAAVRSDAS